MTVTKKPRPRRPAAPRATGASPRRPSPEGSSRPKTPARPGGREKLALLEQLATLGLLARDVVDRLEESAGALTDTGPEAAAWDRALAQGLAGFTASGGDGNCRQTHQALLSWLGGVSQAPSTAEGFVHVLEALRRVIPYSGATLFLRDPDRREVVPFVTVGFEVDLIGRIRFQEGTGFSSWVAGGRKPILYPSLHRNEAPDPDRVRSFIAVPLVLGDTSVGVLNLGHTEDGAFDQGTLRRAMLAGGILTGLVMRHVGEAQIKAREIHDPESGLLTSPYLRWRLDEEVLRCRELGHSMSLLVVELRELKDHVQQFGEDYRGRCRSELARLLKLWQGPTELVGHGEGDTMLAILPAARRERALLRAQALQDLIEHSNFPRRKRMTLGVGLAAYPGDAENPQELRGYADKVLRNVISAPAPAAAEPITVS